MKTGLFGGTFDPIHFGHILPVKEARLELGLDRVIYLPTAIPPHKPDGQTAPPHSRWTMVELALLSEPGLVADPYELTPGREAFTVDSVEHFQAEMPDDELFLIIGGSKSDVMNRPSAESTVGLTWAVQKVHVHTDVI